VWVQKLHIPAYLLERPPLQRLLVGVQPDGTVLIPTNQSLTQLGTVRRVGGCTPKDVALSPDGKTLALPATTDVSFFSSKGELHGTGLCALPHLASQDAAGP
jgi:hypothetical protein